MLSPMQSLMSVPSAIASVDYDVLYGEDFAQPDDDISDDGHIFLNFHNTYFKYSVKE